jgi:hypothetical protein
VENKPISVENSVENLWRTQASLLKKITKYKYSVEKCPVFSTGFPQAGSGSNPDEYSVFERFPHFPQPLLLLDLIYLNKTGIEECRRIKALFL